MGHFQLVEFEQYFLMAEYHSDAWYSMSWDAALVSILVGLVFLTDGLGTDPTSPRFRVRRPLFNEMGKAGKDT